MWGRGREALPSKSTSLGCNLFIKFQSDKCNLFLFGVIEMEEFSLVTLIDHDHVLFSPIESYSLMYNNVFTYGNAIIHSLSGFIKTSRRHNSQCSRKEFSKTTWRDSSS